MKTSEFDVNGIHCLLLEAGTGGPLLLRPTDAREAAETEEETAQLRRLAPGLPFALAAFVVEDWNRDLSPWEAPPVFGKEPFGGDAERTLRFVTEGLLPALQRDAPDRPVFLGGYSLAGLFALWAAYRTQRFRGVAAVSPSVWFPGWTAFAGQNDFGAAFAYLSLGDREARTRNPVLATAAEAIRLQAGLLENAPRCRDRILEWNPGSHFTDPALRTARGFA